MSTANRKRLFAVALAACFIVAIVVLLIAGPVSMAQGVVVLFVVIAAAWGLSHVGGALGAAGGAASSSEIGAGGEPGAVASGVGASGVGTAADAVVGTAGEAATVDRLASFLAHDLCNALSVVKVQLQLLQRELSPSSPRYAERCAVALDQVLRIERTMDQLHAFSRPDRLESAEVDLRDVLHGAVLGVLSRLEAKNIDTVLRDAPALPSVRGDRAKLQRVVQALIENAEEASEPGQRIVLRLSRADLGDHNPGVELSVTDEGLGMTSEQLKQAVEPFFSTKGRGRGLGLAITRRVIDCHGGSVDIDSVPGGGTTVAVRLPAATDPM